MVGTGGEVASFSVWDYVVFAGTILGSAGIGLFQAIRGRKETTSDEFLLGGRQMTAVPVAMSLTASFMSGITVIGTPAEAYRFGTAFWLFGISYGIMSTVTAEIFVPVFYRLGITSTYEYLEMRFNKTIRSIGTTMYITQTVLYTGLVIYAPALALNQITGLDLWGVLVATGVVCILYCTLGGLKAVIWTDVLQMVIMLAGFVAVIARGAVIQGGLGKIWKDAGDGGRLEPFDFSPDPLRRHTFWTIVVGGSVMWVSIYSINQSQVQRYISCKTLTHAKMSLYVNMFGLLLTVSLAMFSGLTMFSIYKDCDPLTNGDISAPDQLLPYLVMDILAAYPGIPGLFVAAAYSGTLSTVSSSINALVAVTVEDFVRPMWKNLTEKQVSWINMGLSVFFGFLCIGMAGVASLMGSILQAALSIFGMISGPLLGLYLLGMFFRTTNSTGGLVGLIIGLSLTLWVGIGSQIYPPTDDKILPLPLSTAGCNRSNTPTMTPWTTSTSQPDVRPPLADSWYSLSYVYFCLLGTMTTMVTGLLVSMITGGCKQAKLNSDLFVKKSDLICFNCCSVSKVEKVPHVRYMAYLIEKTASDVNMGADNSQFSFDGTDKDVQKGAESKLSYQIGEWLTTREVATREVNQVPVFALTDRISSMATNLATLACCLLALSFATATPPPGTGHLNLTGTIAITTPNSNPTHSPAMVTLSNTTIDGGVGWNFTEGKAPLTSTTQDNKTLTQTTATPGITNHPQTTQSTTIWTSVTDSASLMTTIPSTETPNFPVLTTQETQTTANNTSTAPTSTENVSPTANKTSDLMQSTTQGLGLNSSEKNMTILFSIVLGVFAVGLVMYTFHRCKQKIQYLHQPLYNTEDTDRFVADDDTLVISGGLYDDHPICDNQPTATTEQAQFRLEFLHEV
ncbi:sodium-coupled monocarboxylate transporter 1 [Diretmus argenteus]